MTEAFVAAQLWCNMREREGERERGERERERGVTSPSLLR
jgi:hypothetical protein